MPSVVDLAAVMSDANIRMDLYIIPDAYVFLYHTGSQLHSDLPFQNNTPLSNCKAIPGKQRYNWFLYAEVVSFQASD